MRPSICLIILLHFFFFASAQDKWDLERCVTYAVVNNISVKQADVQARISALQLKLAEAQRIPSLGFSQDAGYNFGRSINRATNSYDNRSIFFTGFRLQSSVNLFNWFSQRYAIEASELDVKAANAATDKARNDIAMNVAVGYLQALLAYEQAEVGTVQISQTQAQLDNIRKQVAAGALPELNAAELEAQLARDSATYINSRAVYQQSIIQLKALLNLDMATPFEIEKPNVEAIPVESLADLQPAYVYAEALKNLPQQRVNEFRLQAAQRNIKATRASMYPSLSAFGSIGSNYSSYFPDQQRIVVTPNGKLDTVAYVELSPGIVRPAVVPTFDYSIPNTRFGKQLFNNNLSQAIGVTLTVPIFNQRQLRTNWERAKLNAESIRLQSDGDNLKLQQDIYTAYNDAVNAMQKYNAAQKAVDAADKAFGYSQKRYGVGLLQTIELITNQNNLYRARIDALSARFEYVFRLKLLEFYKGQGVQLR